MDKKKTPAPAVPADSVTADGMPDSDARADSVAGNDSVAGTDSVSGVGTAADAAPTDGAPAASRTERRRRAHAGQVRSRSRIMRFVVSPILLAAALVCAVFAVLTMTVWKPAPTVTASAAISTRYAVTDPGVLGLIGRQAGAELTSDHRVCVALATSQDASGWVSGRRHTRVTGLSSWTELSTRTLTATSVTGAGGPVAFKDSDLWRKVSCGTSVSLRTTASASSPLVLIIDTNPAAPASSTAGRPARLSLTWTRTHTTDTALPLWLCAGLLLLAALLCFFIFSLSDRRRRKARERVEGETRGDPELEHEREQDNVAGADAPRWANDHLRSHRRRDSRHRHSRRHGGIFSSRAKPSAAGSSSSDKDGGKAHSPVIEEPGRANMVARLQETQTMAPISAPIRSDGVGSEIDNGEGRPPSYTPPSNEEVQDYLRRLAQERLGADETLADGGQTADADDTHTDDTHKTEEDE